MKKLIFVSRVKKIKQTNQILVKKKVTSIYTLKTANSTLNVDSPNNEYLRLLSHRSTPLKMDIHQRS